MHDIVDLESRGIPGVFIATEAFVDGAERQASALGFDQAGVYVPHPIQDRTDDELRILAANAVDAIVRGLVG